VENKFQKGAWLLNKPGMLNKKRLAISYNFKILDVLIFDPDLDFDEIMEYDENKSIGKIIQFKKWQPK